MLIRKEWLTAEEFEALIALPEHADRLFELIHGEMIEKMPTNPSASEIAQLIAFYIRLFLREHGIAGHITGAGGGFQVAGDRYAPDVAYLSKARQARLARKGYNPIPPELAVEVETNTTAATERRLRAKVLRYLEAGVLLWVVYPETREVEMYAPGQDMRKLGIADTLDGGDVLPGFRLPLKDIFTDTDTDDTIASE
jgi:Uma2 family endonuclease